MTERRPVTDMTWRMSCIAWGALVAMVKVTMGCKGTVDAMTLMRFMVAWQAQVAEAVVAFCSLRTMSKMTVTRGALMARAVHA